jgi:hypothetical protein
MPPDAAMRECTATAALGIAPDTVQADTANDRPTTPPERPLCRACGERKAQRARKGLCCRCIKDPEVSARFLPTGTERQKEWDGLCCWCGKRPGTYRRGLDRQCYMIPEARAAAPRSRMGFCHRGIDTDDPDVPLAEVPCPCLPGTSEKMAWMMDRASRQELLHHPLDRRRDPEADARLNPRAYLVPGEDDRVLVDDEPPPLEPYCPFSAYPLSEPVQAKGVRTLPSFIHASELAADHLDDTDDEDVLAYLSHPDEDDLAHMDGDDEPLVDVADDDDEPSLEQELAETPDEVLVGPQSGGKSPFPWQQFKVVENAKVPAPETADDIPPAEPEPVEVEPTTPATPSKQSLVREALEALGMGAKGRDIRAYVQEHHGVAVSVQTVAHTRCSLRRTSQTAKVAVRRGKPGRKPSPDMETLGMLLGAVRAFGLPAIRRALADGGPIAVAARLAKAEERGMERVKRR